MSSGIYRIRNVVNGKVYVGSAKDLKHRFYRHRRQLRMGAHHCKHLQAAWVLYGEDCFKFELVEGVSDASQLLEIENRWLLRLYGTEGCYNSAPSAGTTWLGASGEAHPAFGTKRSEDTKAQMRESIKAWCDANPDKVAKGEKHYRFGKTLSPEIRKKIGDTQRGVRKGPRVLSEEGKAKIRAAAEAGNYSHGKGRKRPKEEFTSLVRGCVELTSGKEFFSLNAALREYGIHMPTLRRALLTGKPLVKGPHAGLRFSYLTPHKNTDTLRLP